ncbi:MAG: (2Fe-2S)-binding protein [Candidatus Marinimicrobia bacterium]|nr:(2Fe-2S)-binding protein [Candidatus Neomarinimicrobiota bacterium]
MKEKFIINGKEKYLTFDADERLVTSLRNNGFKEVKNGCLEGECGACMILLDDKPVHSCQIFTASVINKNIQTVKGIGDLHFPHIIQNAFVEAGAVQCGFCTPGFIIAAYALLKENSNPTENEIKRAIDGNLCRCTGYVKIIDAIKNASKTIQKEKVEL